MLKYIRNRALAAVTQKPAIDRVLRALRDEDGSQLVEFSLSILVFLAALLGVFGFCLAVYSYQFVAYASESGARYAMVHGSEWTSACGTSAPPNFTMKYDCNVSATDVQNYVESISMPGISKTAIVATATWPGTTPDCTTSCSTCTTSNSQGCFVKVTVTYPFKFHLPFLPKSTFTVSSTAEKVIQ